MGYRIALVVTLIALGTSTARGDARGVLRIGVAPLALEPSADTPLVGGWVDDAVTAYNTAASSYNSAHGYRAGSPMATAPIDRSALGVHSTLVTFAPGLEAGGEHVYFRLEASLGFGEAHRAIGVGVYPLNVTAPMRRGAIAPYLGAGGIASWLDRTDADGEVGALLAVRVAAGVRFGKRVRIELGYGAIVVGGLLDRARMHTMAAYDPRGSEPPPAPDRAVAGGEAHGTIDVSVGVGL